MVSSQQCGTQFLKQYTDNAGGHMGIGVKLNSTEQKTLEVVNTSRSDSIFVQMSEI